MTTLSTNFWDKIKNEYYAHIQKTAEDISLVEWAKINHPVMQIDPDGLFDRMKDLILNIEVEEHSKACMWHETEDELNAVCKILKQL